jgi:hypothetical protein
MAMSEEARAAGAAKRAETKAQKQKELKQARKDYGDLSVTKLQAKYEGLGLLIKAKKKEELDLHRNALRKLIEEYAKTRGLTYAEAKKIVG